MKKLLLTVSFLIAAPVFAGDFLSKLAIEALHKIGPIITSRSFTNPLAGTPSLYICNEYPNRKDDAATLVTLTQETVNNSCFKGNVWAGTSPIKRHDETFATIFHGIFSGVKKGQETAFCMHYTIGETPKSTPFIQVYKGYRNSERGVRPMCLECEKLLNSKLES
jgi:hypothetical protein